MNEPNSMDASIFRHLVVNEAKKNERFRSDLTVTLKIDVENINDRNLEIVALLGGFKVATPPGLRFTYKKVAFATTDDSNQPEENALMAQFAETFNSNMANLRDDNGEVDTAILHKAIRLLESVKTVEDKDALPSHLMTPQERGTTFLQKVPDDLTDKYKDMNCYKAEDQALPNKPLKVRDITVSFTVQAGRLLEMATGGNRISRQPGTLCDMEMKKCAYSVDETDGRSMGESVST